MFDLRGQVCARKLLHPVRYPPPINPRNRCSLLGLPLYDPPPRCQHWDPGLVMQGGWPRGITRSNKRITLRHYTIGLGGGGVARLSLQKDRLRPPLPPFRHYRHLCFFCVKKGSGFRDFRKGRNFIPFPGKSAIPRSFPDKGQVRVTRRDCA